MTRDEEIEKLALELTLHDLKTVDQAWPTKQEHADHRWDQNMRAAELLFTARDRWRAARQPAPETPTLALQSLRERVAKTLMDASWPAFDASMADVSAAWAAYDAEVIRHHAATLKERKEKADGA